MALHINIFGLNIVVSKASDNDPVQYANKVYKSHGGNNIAFIKDVKNRFELNLREALEICRPIYQGARGN